MKPGDLVRARGCIRLLVDSDWITEDAGTEDGDLMVVLGKAKFKYVRVLHPIHGVRRTHRSNLVPVSR